MINRKSIVIAVLPNAGLGNKMLTYSRAFCFAKKHNLKFYAINWISLQLGPFLRFDRSLRIYNYFNNSEILTFFLLWLKKIMRKAQLEGDTLFPINRYYIFTKIFVDNDYFIGLRENKDLIREELYRILKKPIQQKIDNLEIPDVAIHIRRGDFKNGSTLTEISYFIDVLKFIKSKIKRELRVVIFSDGNAMELFEILEIEGVTCSGKQPDIVDIFQMAKSKIFIPSIGSTFSYWAAFLTCGIVIRNKEEWHTNFLNIHEFNVREFVFSKDNDLLSYHLEEFNL